MASAEDKMGEIASPEGKSPAEKGQETPPEVVSVDLPAPAGWKKKLTLKKGGTPRRNEVVFTSPTGEEIRSKKQLDQYLRSHRGGPPASEFDWGYGDTPRRSLRISEKAKATETPESEPPKKRERKSSSKKGAKEKKDNADGEDGAPEEGTTVAEAKDIADTEMKDAEDGMDKAKEECVVSAVVNEGDVEQNSNDKPKEDEVVTEEKSVDDPKQEEVKTEEENVDEPKEEEVKTEEENVDEPKQEGAKTEEKNVDESKEGEVKIEDKNVDAEASKVVPEAEASKVEPVAFVPEAEASKVDAGVSVPEADDEKIEAGKEDPVNSEVLHPISEPEKEKEIKGEEALPLSGSHNDERDGSIAKEMHSMNCDDAQQQPKASPVSCAHS